MGVDRSFIGSSAPGETLLISRSRLRFFAKATGQMDPVYTDVDTARAAGHRDLPVPSTFFTAIDLENPRPFAWLDALGVDLRSILHGEQQFAYHRIACAGDELSTRSTITDIYERKGGALTFIERATAVVNEADEPVADALSVVVVRQLELA